MPDNNEWANVLRVVIQEELKPINERLSALEAGQQETNKRLTTLETGQEDLKEGQAAIEAAVNDLRTINRRTHKEVFNQLNTIWDDIKRLSSEREKAIR